jgi:DNA (cytosine-5)-methyltransferase 1
VSRLLEHDLQGPVVLLAVPPLSSAAGALATGGRGMTFGSLFAGIGGFDLGFERAGLTCKWQVEIDPFCQRVLEKHWPHVQRFSDVRTVGAHNLERVDVLCGGFPCQPVSRAGLKLGPEDERWLWPEFARLVGDLRPRYVVVENVAALLTRGRGMDLVLGDLAALGFDAEWDCLPAAAFGAPHLRDRVWLLAYPGSERGGSVSIGAEAGPRRPDVLPEGDDRPASEWREDRELVALVPGVRPGVAEDWWRSQSRMDRSAHGVPDLVERCSGLGNAIVPPIAEWIGHRLMEVA